jgi:hypothetical protein
VSLPASAVVSPAQDAKMSGAPPPPPPPQGMFVLMRLYLGFRVLRDRSPLWRNRGMIETEMTQRCGTSLPASPGPSY